MAAGVRHDWRARLLSGLLFAPAGGAIGLVSRCGGEMVGHWKGLYGPPEIDDCLVWAGLAALAAALSAALFGDRIVLARSGREAALSGLGVSMVAIAIFAAEFLVAVQRSYGRGGIRFDEVLGLLAFGFGYVAFYAGWAIAPLGAIMGWLVHRWFGRTRSNALPP
jgi:hypothetical protein